jgi:hypothetical protein
MLGATLAITTLASADGLEGWQAVVGEFRRTLDDPFRGLPLLAAVAGFFLIVWLNIRLARVVLRQMHQGG